MKTPNAVAKEYEDIRKKFPFFIALKKIKNRYYLYKQITRTDRATKKTKILTTYLGRITEEGKFIEKGATKDYELENAIKIIEAMGGKVELQRSNLKPRQIEGQTVDVIDKMIFTELSMNSRIKLSKLCKIVNLSKKKVETRIRRLERIFGIRYIAEVDTRKLGYQSYIVFAKFNKEKPSKEALQMVLVREPRVQLAMLTRGMYDIIMYLLVDSDNDLSDTIANIRSNESLDSYQSDWYVTPLYETYGFIPIREQFFDLLREKVWKKTKENLRPGENQLYNRDFLVLKELNSNSSINFADIDRKYGFDIGGAKYSYRQRLERTGIIERSTLTMMNSGVKYNAIIMMNITVRKDFVHTRKNLLKYEIEDTHELANKLSFLADVKVPNGGLFLLPIYKDGELETEEEKLKREVKGIDVNSMVVTDVLVGNICYRRFDNTRSNPYETILEQYNEDL